MLPCPMRLRMVVANDPRSYREVMAGTLRTLRPDVEVILIEPQDLDLQIVGLDPHLVVCSNLTDTVRARSLGWVVLYPDGQSHAMVCIDGTSSTVEDMEFEGLLSVVDRVDRLVNIS